MTIIGKITEAIVRVLPDHDRDDSGRRTATSASHSTASTDARK